MSIQFMLALMLAWALSLAGAAGAAYHYGAKNTHNADVAAAVTAKADADRRQMGVRNDIQALARSAFLDHEAKDRQLAEERAKSRALAKTIREQVSTYVTTQANRMCTLTTGFVSLHDAAASGEPLLGPPAGTDPNGPGIVDRPSGVAPSQAAEVIADNYATGHEWQALVTGLRARVRELETFYDNLKAKTHACY